jgi:hypothetical protein
LLALGATSVFGQLAKTSNTLTKEVPINIDIKKSDSKDWLHEMEVVVTNNGEKPIYYLYIVLIFDGLMAESGDRMGVPLRFGSGRMYSTVNTPEKDDPFIKPHEGHTFRISDGSADAWAGSFEQGRYPRPTGVTAELGWISFGDASGFTGGNVKYEKKKN